MPTAGWRAGRRRTAGGRRPRPRGRRLRTRRRAASGAARRRCRAVRRARRPRRPAPARAPSSRRRSRRRGRRRRRRRVVGLRILVHAERSGRREVDRAGHLEVVVASLVVGDRRHRVVAVDAVGAARELDVRGDQRLLYRFDGLALGAGHEHGPRRRRRADVLPGEHPFDDRGDERRDGVDATRGEMHAVGLEPPRRAVRVRRPVADLEVAVRRRRGLEELFVVLAEGVDARLLLGVGVVDVVARPQAQPDDVVDALAAGLVDDSGDRLVDRPDRVVVTRHHDEHVAELALERVHRHDHVGRPVPLAADAGLLDRASARLGAEHEVEPFERAVVGVPAHAGERRVADQADVRSVPRFVEEHGLVGASGRSAGDQRAGGDNRRQDGSPAPSRRLGHGSGTTGGCHQIVTS